MGKPIQDQFADFKGKHKKLTNAKINQIAFEYANSAPEFARTYFSQKYGISQTVFYRVLEFAIICGLVVGLVIGLVTEIYTSSDYRFVKKIAQQSETGPATTVISGIAVGMQSTAVPRLTATASTHRSRARKWKRPTSPHLRLLYVKPE